MGLDGKFLRHQPSLLSRHLAGLSIRDNSLRFLNTNDSGENPGAAARRLCERFDSDNQAAGVEQAHLSSPLGFSLIGLFPRIYEVPYKIG